MARWRNVETPSSPSLGTTQVWMREARKGGGSINERQLKTRRAVARKCEPRRTVRSDNCMKSNLKKRVGAPSFPYGVVISSLCPRK